MKKYLFFATALTLLASCTDDTFVGENSPNRVAQKDIDEITFSNGFKAVTRANTTGADAAALLNNNFVVEGIKTVGSTVFEVFDNYNVNWTENTADKTLSNTANWEYVGQAILSGKTEAKAQTIKYWDYAASQYDFWAYSLGGGSATVSSLAHDATLTTAAYTFSGSASDLSKVFISDLVTAYNPTVDGLPAFQQQVNLTFRALVAKIRVGLYETIPGYSVKNVLFYPAAGGTQAATVALYAASAELPSTGTSTVYFPKVGSANKDKADYNKAHITFDGSGTKSANQTYGTLSYGAKEDYEKTTGNIWLARNSAQPTWGVEAGKAAGDYSIVLPNESGSVLTLKVDYTLESTDGSGEEITIHGATALVPAQYTQWKSNYAYTYIFKISDNTNGKTDVTTGPEGLYPITFDAVVVDSEEYTQETITTVATPSITTYSVTSNVTTNNEYTTGDDIYITATSDGALNNFNNYGVTLYDLSATATEAQVLDALNKYVSNTSGTYVGRNGITLTPVASALDLTATEIPLVDGNKITGLTAGQVALTNKSKLTAGHTYAFVYKTTEAAAIETKKYEAVTLAANEDATNYFTTNDGTDTAATTNTTDSQIVYDRYFVVNNVTYAIKVIKIKA